MTALIARTAQRDLQAAVRWIAADNPTASRGLRDAVLKAARQIGDHPHCGVLRPDLMKDRYRVLVLTGFPYVLVYTAEHTPPVILRVLHGTRDLADLLRGN
jgi:toxin ParE1/3/4